MKRLYTTEVEMNSENTKTLINTFPKLYREVISASPNKIQYGIYVDDGWYQLVYKLSSDIEQIAIEEGIDPQSIDWPMVTQIKQKFGGLKFYCRTGEKEAQPMVLEEYGEIYSIRPYPSNKAMARLIYLAEEKSRTLCEVCGLRGKLRNRGWIKTLCDKCSIKITN